MCVSVVVFVSEYEESLINMQRNPYFFIDLMIAQRGWDERGWVIGWSVDWLIVRRDSILYMWFGVLFYESLDFRLSSLFVFVYNNLCITHTYASMNCIIYSMLEVVRICTKLMITLFFFFKNIHKYTHTHTLTHTIAEFVQMGELYNTTIADAC